MRRLAMLRLSWSAARSYSCSGTWDCGHGRALHAIIPKPLKYGVKRNEEWGSEGTGPFIGSRAPWSQRSEQEWLAWEK